MDDLGALRKVVEGLAYVAGYIIGPNGQLISRKDGTVLDTRGWEERRRDMLNDPAALLEWMNGEIKASSLSPQLLAEIGSQSKAAAQPLDPEPTAEAIFRRIDEKLADSIRAGDSALCRAVHEWFGLSGRASEQAALPVTGVIRSDNGEMELDMRSGRFTLRTAVRADGQTVQAGIGVIENATPKMPPEWIIMKDGQAYINTAILSSLPLKNSAITALYPDGTIGASFSKE